MRRGGGGRVRRGGGGLNVAGLGLTVYSERMSPSLLFPSSLQAKCHQYWPEAGSVSFGDLTVTILEVQELAYYTIRTFRMQKVQMTPM